jgi:transcriptional regulator with XRE-family HTH domain
MDVSIGKRLKEFRYRTGRKMSAIATATGIKIDNLYKWEKGTRPANVSEYNTLLQYLQTMDSIPENWTSDPHYTHTPPRPTFMRIALKQHSPPVPVNMPNLSAGIIVMINEELNLIVDYFEAPFLGSIDGVIDVQGDSMSPTFKSGSKIAITRLQDPTLLNWGEHYFIIDKNHDCLLKRVGPDKKENSIVLKSDNPDEGKYPPISRRWEQIETIFKVKACITRL